MKCFKYDCPVRISNVNDAEYDCPCAETCQNNISKYIITKVSNKSEQNSILTATNYTITNK